MENYKLNVTKGKVTVSNYNERSECFELNANDLVGNMIAKTTFSDKYKEEAQANATLITESFNVLHDSGYTPSELLAQNKELLDALKDANSFIYDNRDDLFGERYNILSIDIQQAITNATK
jgi:hypothetical protein